MAAALILIDFINDIVHQNGKLAGKGYFDYIKANAVLQNLSNSITKCREQNLQIIHARVGSSDNYREQPKSSPLFGKADEFTALQLNTWGTEFCEQIEVSKNDIVVTKHRASAFYATPLDLILKNIGVDSIFIAGVATDLAVSSTVRDAHDRDYNVTVLEDCCAAANKQDHDAALLSLSKIAEIKKFSEVF